MTYESDKEASSGFSGEVGWGAERSEADKTWEAEDVLDRENHLHEEHQRGLRQALGSKPTSMVRR